MGTILQALVLTLLGIVLLWFGFTLFFATPGGISMPVFKRKKIYKSLRAGTPGESRTCPVCGVKLEHGERVKSLAFPSTGGADRLMHISGCVYCLGGNRQRVCPVCRVILKEGEYLVARLFEKPYRSHVHVFGCSYCHVRRK